MTELKKNNEIVGVLSKIKEEETKTKLVFSILKEVEIPADALSSDELREMQGRRIGVLNIEGKYHVRKIKSS